MGWHVMTSGSVDDYHGSEKPAATNFRDPSSILKIEVTVGSAGTSVPMYRSNRCRIRQHHNLRVTDPRKKISKVDMIYTLYKILR
jgi:hypothetical protein